MLGGKTYSTTVFCYQICYDLLWEKKCPSDWEKLLKFKAEGREFSKNLSSLNRTIYSNSELLHHAASFNTEAEGGMVNEWDFEAGKNQD